MGLLAQANGNPPIRQGLVTLRFAAGWVLSEAYPVIASISFLRV